MKHAPSFRTSSPPTFRLLRRALPGRTLVVLAIAACFLAEGRAEAALKRVVAASGAVNSTGPSNRLRGTIGQGIVGRLSTTNPGLRLGFWYIVQQPAVTAVEPGPTRIPVAFRLDPNVPNPFRNVTRWSFALPQERHVTLRIFDVTGRAIATPIDQTMSPGEYTFVFEPRDMTSGTYFYELRAGSFIQRKRFVRLR